jgi:hypothetical protein
LGVAALAYVLAQLIVRYVGVKSEEAIGFAVSIFVGGVALVVQFLAGADRTMDSLLEQVHENVAGLGAQLREVNSAIQQFREALVLERTAAQTDALHQLVKNATSIGKTNPPLIFDFAQNEVFRLSGYLRNLGQQADVTYDGEDRDWLLGLARVARSSIDATSLTTVDGGGQGFVDGGLWSSDLGYLYLQLQRNAIMRGVTIRRVFIMDRPDLISHPDLAAILRRQHEMGVEVRTLDPTAIGPNRRYLLVDFIVIDSVLAYTSTPVPALPNDTRPSIVSTRLVTDPERINQWVNRYRELWDLATPYDPSQLAQSREE